MAKRGWKAIARVRFAWEDGPKGTITCYFADEIETAVATLTTNAKNRGRHIDITVEPITPKETA